jgi:hypothetical protein
MGNLKNFFFEQKHKFINYLQKRQDRFIFSTNYFYNDLKTKILNLKSVEDFIIKLLYLEKSAFVKKNEKQKKFDEYLKKNNIYMPFYKFGINDILYGLDRKFYDVIDGFLVYINYINYNKYFYSKFYKSNPINLKLLQTKNNFQYNLSNKIYKNYLNLFCFGLKSLFNSLKL